MDGTSRDAAYHSDSPSKYCNQLTTNGQIKIGSILYKIGVEAEQIDLLW